MNMQAMMMQARKIQKEIETATREIEATTFTYENENIKVDCLGTNEIKRIDIKNSDILEDKELLEDIIIVAVNDILKQIENEKEKKLGKYTNGLGGLF